MNLGAGAFSLFQDGQQQEIRYFSTTDAPISLALVLDLSGSMRNKFAAEQDALRAFASDANAQDEYSIITFSDRPKLVAASTQSIDALESSLSAEKPKGDTAMLDAIWQAADSLRSARYDRRRVLVISDGADNHSRHSLGQLQRHLAESAVEVYAIGIFDDAPFKTWEESMGRKWLSRFTDATGGRTIAVGKGSDLPKAAARISREMREQYVLGYRPSLTQNSPAHPKIQVKVSPAPGTPPVRAFYKTGYAAESGDALP
jgi:Ca-activated chloride channel family protein